MYLKQKCSFVPYSSIVTGIIVLLFHIKINLKRFAASGGKNMFISGCKCIHSLITPYEMFQYPCFLYHFGHSFLIFKKKNVCLVNKFITFSLLGNLDHGIFCDPFWLKIWLSYTEAYIMLKEVQCPKAVFEICIFFYTDLISSSSYFGCSNSYLHCIKKSDKILFNEIQFTFSYLKYKFQCQPSKYLKKNVLKAKSLF